MVTVSINYKLGSEEVWQRVEVTATDYFDMDCLEESEPVEVDSIPRYDDELDYIFDMIGDTAKQIVSAKTVIRDTATGATIEFLSTYWNNQRNRIVERIDSGVSGGYYEVIITSEISKSPVMTEIIRLIRRDGMLVPCYHGIITDNSDGSESELKLVP